MKSKLTLGIFLVFSSLSSQAAELPLSARKIIFDQIQEDIFFEDEGLTRSVQNLRDLQFKLVDESKIMISGDSYSAWDQKRVHYECESEVLVRGVIRSDEDVSTTCQMTGENWPHGKKRQRVDRHQLFVKLRSGEGLPESDRIKGVKPLHGRWILVRTSNAKALARELKGSQAIEHLEFNTFHGKEMLPKLEPTPPLLESVASNSPFNDPQVSRIWSFLDDSGFGVSVNKTYSAFGSQAREDVIVAVVDTGVDYRHEDLESVMWVNPGEIPGNRKDDDGNGYVDDVHGINTLVRDSNGVASGNPAASHAHGTHVAGTIGAAQNNRIGIAGIASRARIMAIRTVPDDADETDVDIVESFLYAAKHGARLINCSFGKKTNEGGMVVAETIDHIASTYGTLVVAAAGNDSTPFSRWDIDQDPKYPASFASDGLLVVAATNSTGGLASFSNVGRRSVDLAAPGVNIFSTIPKNAYGGMSGTSMATPTVVGVLAEILGRYPSLTPFELKKIAIESVTPVSSFKGMMVSGGRANLYNALQAAGRYR
ncbi:MAG: S8 family serine peptidase [Bdellovibrionales bacterium]|nr:S8 family serine peptidase [Bdellovibrionales bacterium]